MKQKWSNFPLIKAAYSIELKFHFNNNNIVLMQMQNQVETKKREYSHISIKKRMQLVKDVLKKGKPLSQVVKELDIKITTARFIINKYRESGSYPRRKFRKTGQSNKKKEVFLPNVEESQPDQVQENNIRNEGAEVKSEGPTFSQVSQQMNLAPPTYIYWYYYPIFPSNQLLL